MATIIRMDMSSYQVEREECREPLTHQEDFRNGDRHPALALLQVAPALLPRREMVPPRLLASRDVDRFLHKMCVTLQ